MDLKGGKWMLRIFLIVFIVLLFFLVLIAIIFSRFFHFVTLVLPA